MKLRSLCCAVLFAAACASANTTNPPLRIYLWEDTLSEQVAEQWLEKHTQPIEQIHFDNDDERSLLMLNSKSLPFDIVVLDNVTAQIYARHNMFEDLSELNNRDNNHARWNALCGTHAVPYFWGPVGYVYRQDLISTPPKTWAELVEPSDELKGHIGWIKDSTETLLPALYGLGYSPTSESSSELKQAYDILNNLAPSILTFEYALSYIRSNSQSNELKIALAYAGDEYSMNRFQHHSQWRFKVPEGESFIWTDCLAVNAHSSNKEQAKAFLSFLMIPEIAAINAIDIRAATPNQNALKLMPASYLNDRNLNPEDHFFDEVAFDEELSVINIRQRARIIDSIVKRHEATN
ncbi:polyamine ABC transporter substrate-binding protein [Vibrio astriarenae]|uniref:polyamine ABC transporter substrate-binding protein n=1 Tax=Vibrio astriarenae TaxID=1481923 RepID=UPI003735A664